MMMTQVRTICLAGALCLGSASLTTAQDAPPHKITAQEVAEMLADPSATITYFNLSYRAYMDVGPFDDKNHELRLNGAGFLRLPNETSILYRAYLPLYSSSFPFDDDGVGDFLASAYWVPRKGNFIVGFGGALMMPTASEDYFGTGKWSMGPTLVVAKKAPGKYTVGGLLTQIWSFAGSETRATVSITTIQPGMTVFLNRKGTSVIAGSETTYNWKADDDAWQIPVTLGMSQVLPPFGKFFVGVGVAGSYYIEKSDYAPEWDVRGVASIVLP